MRGRGFLNLYIFLISMAGSNPDTSVSDRNGNWVDSPLEASRSTDDADGGTTVLGPVSLPNSMPTEPVTAVSVFVQNKDTSTLLVGNVSETQEASIAVQVIVPLSTPVANIMVKTSSTPPTALQEESPKSNGVKFMPLKMDHRK